MVGAVLEPDGLRCENMRDDTGRVRVIEMDPSWDTVAWLRGMTGLPILLKGVLHPADARLAVEHGVDGLIVSNHGGRQLDGAIATLDALPAVVAAVSPRALPPNTAPPPPTALPPTRRLPPPGAAKSPGRMVTDTGAA